ncbi:MAG: hypothetical protein ACJAXK_001249 [Yoonia sp.]|jgi:hypothetical protein
MTNFSKFASVESEAWLVPVVEKEDVNSRHDCSSQPYTIVGVPYARGNSQSAQVPLMSVLQNGCWT